MDKQILFAAKIAFFIYIVLSPFINYKYIQFLNSVVAKVLLIIVIVMSSFVDLQLAIIITIAFLVLMINLNKDAIFGINNSIPTTPKLSEHFASGMPLNQLMVPNDNMVTFPDKCSDTTYLKEEISTDLYDLYIDPKVKPYEMYIKQLCHPDSIENASNNT